MIRAIFFDADGTLISHKTKSVPQSARKAIEVLRAKGIKCFLCTGRHKLELVDLPIADMEFDGYVCLNGQIILDGSTNFICGDPFDQHTLEFMVNCFNRKSYPLLFIEKDRLYLNYVDEMVQTVQQRISSPIPSIGQYHGDPVYMACAYADPIQAEAIIKSLPSTLKTTYWANGGIDIINNDGGKTKGIQKVQEIYGYTREEIMAIGDGDNDVQLLATVKHGIAMRIHDPKLDPVATMVTGTVKEEGIYHALKKLEVI